MPKLIDLTGQQFERLTVIKRHSENLNGRPAWVCKCTCGNEVIVRGNDLRIGYTKSCGCLGREKLIEYNQNKGSVKVGDKIGRLTVIDDLGFVQIGQESNRRKMVLCQCECGNVIKITTHEIKRKYSCGCDKSSSKGEQKVYDILIKNNHKVQKEKIFNTCKFIDTNHYARFDFFVDNNYLIEYNGEQHYKDTNFTNFEKVKERDKFKIQWCKENNIPLIIIPYTCFKKLSIEDLELQTTKYRVV